MSNVFISYAHEDRATAKVLAELLGRRGLSVFWDRQIQPGATWDEIIERELKEARCVIVLWSKNSVTSKWVKTEAGEAAERSVLLPVLIEEADLPLRFKSIQTAMLVNWDGNEDLEELRSVIQAVQKLVTDGPAADTSFVARTASTSRPIRRRRWLVYSLMTVAVVGAGLFGAYRVGDQKGWFARKLAYYTELLSGEGLTAGDPVYINGRPVGEILKIDLNPPESYYNVVVFFNIREPYYGFVWTDSRAVVQWNPSGQKRAINVSNGKVGIPAYIFHPLADLPVDGALPGLQRNETVLAQDIYDGTNVVLAAFRGVSAEGAARLAQLGVKQVSVAYRRQLTKEPTAIWDWRSYRYAPVKENRYGFYLASDEATTAKP